jgi:hypothetical protein
LEWNDYFIGIAISVFGRDLLFGIAIPFRKGIAIPERIDNIFQKQKNDSFL